MSERVLARPFVTVAAVMMIGNAAALGAQGQQPSSPAAPAPQVVATDSAGVIPPPDYIIGPEDQLSIVFYQDKDMTADVIVRPDGKISLPLLNDVQASGLTPDQLRQRIIGDAKRLIQDPKPTVVVRQINSRKVFITGAVEHPGNFPLMGPTTVLQLIALAGGIKEYADAKKILIIRNEGGRAETFNFNYKDVVSQKNMAQNILLRPGDTVVVP